MLWIVAGAALAVELEVGTLSPGRPVVATVAGASPPLELRAGPLRTPCGVLPTCLDPDRLVVLGDFALDGEGAGQLSVPVPASLASAEVTFQAVNPETDEASALVTRTAILTQVGELTVRDAAGLARLQRTQAVLTEAGEPATIYFEPGSYGPVIDLPLLQVGNLILRRGMTLTAPALERADHVVIDGALSEVDLSLPLLARAEQLSVADTWGGVRVEAPRLAQLGSLAVSGNRGAVTVEVPALSEVAEGLTLTENEDHALLSADALHKVGGRVQVTRNTALEVFSLPGLIQAGSLFVGQNDALAQLGPFAAGLTVGTGACGSAGTLAGNPLLTSLEGPPPTFLGSLSMTRNRELGACVAGAWFTDHAGPATCEDNALDFCSFFPGPCGTSGPVTPGGAPPAGHAAALIPAEPRPRERTQCGLAAEAVDPEGLSVHYTVRWRVDGLPYTGPLETTVWPDDTVPAGVLTPGQSWSCELVPSDCAVSGAPARASAAVVAPTTNVLLLLLDDVGTDKISWYAEHPDPPQTPYLDSFLDEAVVFDGVVVAPSCSPTRAALLTGRFPRRTGVGNAINFDVDPYILPESEQTLPEVLRLAPDPWTSVLIGKWHLSSQLVPGFEVHPLTSGFDQFVGVDSNLYETVEPLPGAGYYNYNLNTNGVYENRTTYATVQQVDDALAQMATVEEPFFLNLSFSAAHLPWEMPPEDLFPPDGVEDPSLLSDRMKAMVEVLDAEIERLLTTMDPGLLARTTVVLISDNGTAREVILPPWDPLRGKLTNFQGGIRVPMAISGPVVTRPGRRVAAQVSMVDLFPTVMDLAGLPPTAAERVLDGHSLLPYLYDPAQAPLREVNFTDRFSPNGAGPYTEFESTMVTDGRYKLIDDLGGEHLYELSAWWEDGPDLLEGVPDGLQTAAWYRLRQELAQRKAEQVFLE